MSHYGPSCVDEAWAEDRLVRLCINAHPEWTVKECDEVVSAFLEEQYRSRYNDNGRRRPVENVLRPARWLTMLRLRAEREPKLGDRYSVSGYIRASGALLPLHGGSHATMEAARAEAAEIGFERYEVVMSRVVERRSVYVVGEP